MRAHGTADLQVRLRLARSLRPATKSALPRHGARRPDNRTPMPVSARRASSHSRGRLHVKCNGTGVLEPDNGALVEVKWVDLPAVPPFRKYKQE